jgi:hypothetical protein
MLNGVMALAGRENQERLLDCRTIGCGPEGACARPGVPDPRNRSEQLARPAISAGLMPATSASVLVEMLGRTPSARRDSPVSGAVRPWRLCLPLWPVCILVSALAGTELPFAKPPSVTAPKGAVCYPSIDGSNRSPVGKASRFESSIGPRLPSGTAEPPAPILTPHGLADSADFLPRSIDPPLSHSRGPLRATRPLSGHSRGQYRRSRRGGCRCPDNPLR